MTDPTATDPSLVRIRAATVEDSAAIGELHVAAWRETYRGLMPDRVLDSLSASARAEQWRSGLVRGAKGPLVFVVEAADGSLCGFGAAGPSQDSPLGWQAEIYALYLLRSSQRRGIGTALLRRLWAELQARNRRKVGLWVLTTNADARAFYARLGGAVVDHRIDASAGWDCDETAYFWNDLPEERETQTRVVH